MKFEIKDVKTKKVVKYDKSILSKEECEIIAKKISEAFNFVDDDWVFEFEHIPYRGYDSLRTSIHYSTLVLSTTHRIHVAVKSLGEEYSWRTQFHGDSGGLYLYVYKKVK